MCIRDRSTSGGVGNSSVVTDRSGISGSFTVSYPAETTIYWGTESTEIGYTVSSTLVSGNNLRVTVAQDLSLIHISYKVEPRKPAVLTAGMIGAQIPFAPTRAKIRFCSRVGISSNL